LNILSTKFYTNIFTIAGLPLIQRHPVNQIVNDSQKAIFKCFVNGSNSSLTVTWEKDKKHYTSGNIKNINESNGVSSTLKLNNARVKDSGKYQCRATNVDGRNAASNEAELISKHTQFFTE